MTKPCPVAECDRQMQTRGFCQKHYMLFRRVDPSRLAPIPTDVDRFWAKIAKTDTCWMWTGAPSVNGGYGTLHITTKTGRRPHAAHRYSYELLIGPIPDGMQHSGRAEPESGASTGIRTPGSGQGRFATTGFATTQAYMTP